MFRLQRHDVIVSGSDNGRCQHGVEVLGLGLVLATQARRTMRAADVVGTEILGAIEGDQHVLAGPAEG